MSTEETRRIQALRIAAYKMNHRSWSKPTWYDTEYIKFDGMEYKIIDSHSDKAQDVLNKLGHEGWYLIQLLPYLQPHALTQAPEVYFKCVLSRPVMPNDPQGFNP